MVFYVYIDPAIINIATRNAPYGLQLLIAILRGFLQNCFIVDFTDGEIHQAIGEKVKSLPPTDDRKRIKAILSSFVKHNRFIYCLAPDYTGQNNAMVLMLDQAAEALIDLALLETQPDTGKVPETLQITMLLDYQNTQFEIDRSKISSNGKTIAPNIVEKDEFLNTCFLKVFRHATKIEICDKLFGARFNDNYKYSAGELFKWLPEVLADIQNQEVIFHCGKPDGYGDKHLETTIKELRDSHLSGLSTKIQYYDMNNLPDSLPHDRFILTNQIALSIGRGMDFLDRSTKKVRDITINIINRNECSNVLQHYSGSKLNLIDIGK